MTDILYVTYGAGHAFGVNLDKCFDEVQKSNMSKLGEDGKPIYNEEGKVLKGPNYFKPNISKFLNKLILFFLKKGNIRLLMFSFINIYTFNIFKQKFLVCSS